MPLGGDQAHLGTTPLNQRIGAHGGAMGQQIDAAAKLVKVQAHALGHQAHGIEHAVGKGRWRGRRFGSNQLATAGDDDAIGERSPDVNADLIVVHLLFLVSG